MSTENVNLVRRAYEAYARGDLAAVFAMLDEKLTVRQTPLLPWGGDHHGHAGARTFFQQLATHTDARPMPSAYIDAGEDVAVIGRLKGHARSTGRPIDMDIVHLWTVRNGKLLAFSAYIDTPAMLAALGESDTDGA
jgi:uncharacterized protein